MVRNDRYISAICIVAAKNADFVILIILSSVSCQSQIRVCMLRNLFDLQIILDSFFYWICVLILLCLEYPISGLLLLLSNHINSLYSRLASRQKLSCV